MIERMTRRDFSQAPICFRYFGSTLCLLLWLFPGPVLALEATQNADFDRAFQTDARFMVGKEVHTTVSALAWIEEHPAFGAGYHRLTIGFYPFHLSKQQTGEAAAGNYQPIEDRVTADYYSVDYKSYVRVLLNIYEGNKVGHVDITLPGSFCTITPFQNGVEDFLQDYLFERGRLRLKSRGSYVCGTLFPDLPNKTYQWEFDIDLPVFEFSDQ